MSDRIVLIIAGNEFTVNLIRYIKRTCSEVPQSRLVRPRAADTKRSRGSGCIHSIYTPLSLN